MNGPVCLMNWEDAEFYFNRTARYMVDSME